MDFILVMEQNAFVIRPLNTADLEWFYNIANMFGVGFTSLVNDKDYLYKRLDIVEKSFKGQIPIEDRIYLFVRENLYNNEKIGLCGIDVNVGYKESFYNYQLSNVTQASKNLDVYKTHTILNLVNNFQSASELISFWVHPNYRGQSVGKSLSLSRFMFIAQFVAQFGSQIVAELRGVVDANGASPFWEAVGKNFFGMDFQQADALTLSSDKQFIADLCSRLPIYADLLPLAAQQVIGVEHPDSTPARHLLEADGFRFNNHVDIFDAGPVISANISDIKTIKNNKVANIIQLENKIINGIDAMLYNNQLDARITVDKIKMISNTEIIMSPQAAEILQLGLGSEIRYCPI